MRAHYFQHVSFVHLGSIEPWLRQHGYHITGSHFFSDWQIPPVEDIDLLVIMGGPMSVNDEAQYPWLVEEKAFIRQMLAAGKPILGICLGAQLIASAMGARIYANSAKEIGWWPIEAQPTPPGYFQFPQQSVVFHWHGETFDLPADAMLLASSAACKNQAFQLGNNVIGLQFHLETTAESAQALVAHCGDELQPAPWLQSESQILGVVPQNYQNLHQLMVEVLNYLHDRPGN